MIQPRTTFVNLTRLPNQPNQWKSSNDAQKRNWRNARCSWVNLAQYEACLSTLVGRIKRPCYVKWQKANSCSKSIDNYLFFWHWACWKTATYGVGQWRYEKQPFQIELYLIKENRRGFLQTLFIAMWKGLLCRMN